MIKKLYSKSCGTMPHTHLVDTVFYNNITLFPPWKQVKGLLFANHHVILQLFHLLQWCRLVLQAVSIHYHITVGCGHELCATTINPLYQCYVNVLFKNLNKWWMLSFSEEINLLNQMSSELCTVRCRKVFVIILNIKNPIIYIYSPNK